MLSSPRRSVRCALALLTLPCVLAVTACGKSDKQKVEDQVNGICKDFRKDTASLFNNVDNLNDFAAQGKKAIPKVDQTGRKLSTVKASEDVRKDLGNRYTAFVANFQQTAATFGAAVAAADDGDKPKFGRLVKEIDRLDKKGNKQAKALGFDECAKG
jgi:hypothetical protein